MRAPTAGTTACSTTACSTPPEWDGHDCFWICTLIEPEGPCLCSVLCLEDCGPRHEHGWIDLEEADSEVDA
jgi:hypothetical protein